MVLTKEYRICMPFAVEEYQVGQLYMIARHSLEQSKGGEGVEVVENRECDDPVHGKGHFTEKRIHLSSRLPYWIQSILPRIFYVTEKAWNYYPYTITEYTCSFVPKFHIYIQSKYENNNGCSDNCLELTREKLAERIVEHIDIAYDEVSAKHYKEDEDPRFFKSKKTGRGPLVDGWRTNHCPMMCSYKLVNVSFEVFGLQTKVEDFIHSCIREVLLLGHRQAFAWIDEWIEMDYKDVKEYELKLQETTNNIVQCVEGVQDTESAGDSSLNDLSLTNSSLHSSKEIEDNKEPSTPKSPPQKGYFSWW
ncbi:hypothetical protein HHI36_015664 [Cryptolaemus montrouzieri]|uniref:Cytoplasmic phosphatidylinositol transfer protein 1 n=1 Tax=Cryptolaemus montrouzieri TaxID=559131 RepID=A0ABD2N6N8_9CUCU